jgi:hypothetical protein
VRRSRSGFLRRAHSCITKERCIKDFNPTVMDTMGSVCRRTAQLLQRVRHALAEVRVKLLKPNRGEMAEWLKAAVC